MPAHLKQNKYGVYYLVDGFTNKSLKTKIRREAAARLKQYNEGKFNLAPVPTVQKFYDEWIGKKVPPLVRHSQVRDYKQAFNAYILPRFKHESLSDIGTKELTDFQAELLKKGLAVKTARNIIDGSFRAMFRDARVEIGSDLEGKDPFIDVKWPKVKREPPDPLTTEQKHRVLDAFLEHEPFYYPFVRVQFETGMRPSETVALTWADINIEARTIRINKSRYMSEDNDHPKTTKSGRTITIARALMELIESLRHPWSKETDKVFINKHGEPLNAASFRVDYWDRILDALQIRKRKFYATRHTFITEMVRKDAGKLKKIADYCGTSVAMIEQHYCAISELDPDAENMGDREVFEKPLSKPAKTMASPTGFEPVLSA
jgi:integrase